MAKVIVLRAEQVIYSIPLQQAVYCENCATVSNSRPFRCGVCGSAAVLRVEPIFNRDPDPPALAAHSPKLLFIRAVSA